ncbi:glycosyltransferase family 2 protein [Sulfitobacter sp. MOLA879]|uniref:glycosyltransferase family 2 protein n=1 Tax=Sulfitobacter sp. MOLA879 TaxID=3368579 RepID=UPI0037452B02
MTARKLLSVVTISFNQAEFLRDCIESVLSQKTDDIEYIVVDPGSTDGSHEIIEEYREHIDLVVTEEDDGPADGLNRGFELAQGSIFYYLNSDDIVYPGAFSEAISIFQRHEEVTVLAGSGAVLDSQGKFMRKLMSDPVSRLRLAYGGGILIQPATFIRREGFEAVSGFNKENRSNWDGELTVDLFLEGARFKVVDRIWGGYRLHSESITSTGRTEQLIRQWNSRKREKLGVSNNRILVAVLSLYYRIERVVRSPSRISDRVTRGRVFGRSG